MVADLRQIRRRRRRGDLGQLQADPHRLSGRLRRGPAPGLDQSGGRRRAGVCRACHARGHRPGNRRGDRGPGRAARRMEPEGLDGRRLRRPSAGNHMALRRHHPTRHPGPIRLHGRARKVLHGDRPGLEGRRRGRHVGGRAPHPGRRGRADRLGGHSVGRGQPRQHPPPAGADRPGRPPTRPSRPAHHRAPAGRRRAEAADRQRRQGALHDASLPRPA